MNMMTRHAETFDASSEMRGRMDSGSFPTERVAGINMTVSYTDAVVIKATDQSVSHTTGYTEPTVGWSYKGYGTTYGGFGLTWSTLQELCRYIAAKPDRSTVSGMVSPTVALRESSPVRIGWVNDRQLFVFNYESGMHQVTTSSANYVATRRVYKRYIALAIFGYLLTDYFPTFGAILMIPMAWQILRKLDALRRAHLIDKFLLKKVDECMQSIR